MTSKTKRRQLQRRIDDDKNEAECDKKNETEFTSEYK